MSIPAALSGATVYVVDDDLAIRESLSSLIRSAGLLVQVFESAKDFLARRDLNEHCCLILDVRMPEVDGFDLQRQLAVEGREIPIIFVTGHGDVPLAVRAMKAGALEFLRKPFSDEELLAAIRHALTLSDASCRKRAELADLRARFAALTAREREVVFQVVQGRPNKWVASDLGVSESTVKVHRHNIMAKMRVSSLPELALALQLLKKGG
jgi:FixJ family two-component response regulator